VLSSFVATADVNSTISTLTINTTTDASVTNLIDAYSTTLIAQIQGASTVVDETLPVSASDPTFQAAVAAAEATLASDGATSIAGPTLASSSDTLKNSSQTVDSILSQSSSIQSNTYVGPLTIYVGINQSESFTLGPGQIDGDTLVTETVDTLATTTTTTTDLLTQVYDITGSTVQSVTAPEINTASAGSALTLLMGSLAVCGGAARRKRR